MKKLTKIFVILIIVIGTASATTYAAYSQFDKAFKRNLALEKVYQNAKNLPAHNIACIPVTKYLCNLANCKKVVPKVFNLIEGSSWDSMTISRCDSMGCDTYDAVMDGSGDYMNVQPKEPKGFLFKMSFNSVDWKYVETSTLGLDSYITYGYCK